MFKINYWETYIKTILIFKYFIVFTQTSLANLQSIQTETVIVKFSHIYCFANFNNNNYIVVHVFLGICMHIYRRRQWHPTPVFLPGESQGRWSLVGCGLWVAQSRTRLKRLSSSSNTHTHTLNYSPKGNCFNNYSLCKTHVPVPLLLL